MVRSKTAFIFSSAILALCSVMVLGSCGKGDGQTGCENETKHYYLDTDEKEAIPYKGYDTLRFVSNLGDTINCIGNGIHSFTTRDFQMHSDPACGNNGTEEIYEANRFQFVDSSQNYRIEIENYSFYPDPLYGGGFPELIISFKENKFKIMSLNVSDERAYSYIGNVEQKGNLYEGVNKVTQQSDTSFFLLLNKTNGIIKIQLSTNETWELIEN